jgi:cytochrome P450
VSFNSATALRDIYGAYGTKARLVKADYYTVVGHHFGTMNLVSMDDPAEHARKRRIMAQALTTTAVKGMEDLILKNARLFCEMLGGCGRRGSSAAGSLGGWSPAIDFSEASNCFTFDVMADNVFGENLGMLTEETNRWFLRVLPEAVKFLHIVGQKANPWLAVRWTANLAPGWSHARAPEVGRPAPENTNGQGHGDVAKAE